MSSSSRPGSSLSQHAQTALRPPSSLSRPPSSASYRTASRVSHRSVSRISQASTVRQSSRVASLCQALVSQVTGNTPEIDERSYTSALNLVTKMVGAVTKQTVGLDMTTVERHLRGLERKARIKSQDTLAEALNIKTGQLHGEAEKRNDLDSELKVSKLPDHVQFLIALSMPPSPATQRYAGEVLRHTYNPPPLEVGLTWETILAEEPLEGEHWKGAYNMPPGSVAVEWTDSGSTDSSPPWSPLSDRDDMLEYPISTDSSDVSFEAESPPSPPSLLRTGRVGSFERITQSLELREELEHLEHEQYWRTAWKSDAVIHRSLDLGEPSTLGPAFQRALNNSNEGAFISAGIERYINEHDAVREVLMALLGRQSLLLDVVSEEGHPLDVLASPTSPKLLHLTPAAQESILSSFATLATSLNRLRAFTKGVASTRVDFLINPVLEHDKSRTLEAFAEAVELQLCRCETWCAEKEEEMLRAHLQPSKCTVVSLLSLEKAIRDAFSDTYRILCGILAKLFGDTTEYIRGNLDVKIGKATSCFSSSLLDSLYDAIQSQLSLGDMTTYSALMKVFMQTTEPIWKMLGHWLRDGIFMSEGTNASSQTSRIPREFFVESNEILLTETNFWSDGYELRSSRLERNVIGRASGVPIFLQALSSNILSSGKSVGLLRILERAARIDNSPTVHYRKAWPTFETFVADCLDIPRRTAWAKVLSQTSKDIGDAFSAHDLSLVLSDRLLPVCSSTDEALSEVLFADCGFFAHLHTIEDLFLMRRGDLTSDFCDILFERMDSNPAWTDYHFLNTAFRDVADSMKPKWLGSALTRILYKNNKYSSIQYSVRNLSGLEVEYAPPFPLTFIFGSRSSKVYNNIFVLLIQLRRAKAALDSILARGANSARSEGDLKTFYAMRSRLSWFVNMFLTFIIQNTLHGALNQFHHALRSAMSLDDIIQLHQDHLTSLEFGCLLLEKTSALRRAVLSVLDMSLVFKECFAAFSGNSSFIANKSNRSRAQKHRSRRARRESRNTVTFSQPHSIHNDESDSSDSDFDESVIPEEPVQDATFSYGVSTISFGDEGLYERMDKMSKDLDVHVRFIRRGVESLSTTVDGAQLFEVLAFSLQDWDL